MADLDVTGQLRTLAAVERLRFLQDGVRDAELADVVEQAGQAKPFQPSPVIPTRSPIATQI